LIVNVRPRCFSAHGSPHFIDAYLADQPSSLTGEQGREILRFALAAQESARIGAAVRL
jgi:hypothetical protein